MQSDFFVLAGFVFIFTLTAATLDVKTRSLPNWLNVSSLVLALIFHLGTSRLDGLLFSLSGFAVGFGVLFVLWLIGGGGGGDVKMMGALGAWLGPTLTIVVFLGSVILVGGYGVAVFVWRLAAETSPRLHTAGTQDGNVEVSSARNRTTIAYAVPIAVATWTVLLLKFLAISH